MAKEFNITDEINKPELLENAKALQEEYENTFSQLEKREERLAEADEKIGELEAQLSDHVEGTVEYQKALHKIEELEAQVADLKERLIDSGQAPVPVDGTFSVGSGKNKKTYGFKDGIQRVRDREGQTLPTEELMKIANDADYEPDQDVVQRFSALAGLDQEGALSLLRWYVDIDYGYIEEV